MTKKNDKNESDVFKNVEYITVSLNTEKLETIEGKFINGKTKYEFQKMLGEKYGDHKFNLSQCDKGKFTNKVYFMRGIVTGKKKLTEIPILNKEKNDINVESLIDRLDSNHKIHLDELRSLYEAKSTTNNSIYEIQIKGLESKIKEKDEYIKQLELEIDKINQNESGDMTKTIQTILALKNVMTGNIPQPKLQDKPVIPNNDIPKEFLELFSSVDYSKVSENDLQTYYSVLNQFISKLPQKTKEV